MELSTWKVASVDHQTRTTPETHVITLWKTHCDLKHELLRNRYPYMGNQFRNQYFVETIRSQPGVSSYSGQDYLSFLLNGVQGRHKGIVPQIVESGTWLFFVR